MSRLSAFLILISIAFPGVWLNDSVNSGQHTNLVVSNYAGGAKDVNASFEWWEQ